MASGVLSTNIYYDSATDGLTIDGVDVASAIVGPFGTPTYAYSVQSVLRAYRTIRRSYSALHPNVSIHFSLKSNANFTLVKALVAEGAGIDCVSAGEVFKALRCGCPASRIVFAGVGKTFEELQFAVAKGVAWFNVENELELTHLSALAVARRGASATAGLFVALRINPDVVANTHPNIATGHGGAKFGISIETAHSILSTCAERYPLLTFAGVHLHIGSQLGDTVQTHKAIRIALDLVAPYPFVTCLNIGGGLPVTYNNQPMPEADDFAQAVCPLLQKYHVLLEPGRCIVAPSAVLLTRVLYRKEQAGHKMLIVDASMTELMRPALYGAQHLIVPVNRKGYATATQGPLSPDFYGSGDDEAAASAVKQNLVEFTIVGPVCETTDVLSKSTFLPDALAIPGTLLAILTVGAYGATMANNYNARPIPPQICVLPSGKVFCSVKRQTFEELVQGELDQANGPRKTKAATKKKAPVAAAQQKKKPAAAQKKKTGVAVAKKKAPPKTAKKAKAAPAKKAAAATKTKK